MGVCGWCVLRRSAASNNGVTRNAGYRFGNRNGEKIDWHSYFNG